MGRASCLNLVLQQAGLKVNLKESKLGFTEIDYLSYIVEEGRLKPQRKNVKAILEALRPQTQKHLQTFGGVTGYCSCFITCFAMQLPS